MIANKINAKARRTGFGWFLNGAPGCGLRDGCWNERQNLQ
jgi:hypothetical protein